MPNEMKCGCHEERKHGKCSCDKSHESHEKKHKDKCKCCECATFVWASCDPSNAPELKQSLNNIQFDIPKIVLDNINAIQLMPVTITEFVRLPDHTCKEIKILWPLIPIIKSMTHDIKCLKQMNMKVNGNDFNMIKPSINLYVSSCDAVINPSCPTPLQNNIPIQAVKLTYEFQFIQLPDQLSFVLYKVNFLVNDNKIYIINIKMNYMTGALISFNPNEFAAYYSFTHSCKNDECDEYWEMLNITTLMPEFPVPDVDD